MALYDGKKRAENLTNFLLEGGIELPGLEAPPVAGLDESSTTLPFFPTGEVLQKPNPGWTESEVTRGQRQAYKAALTESDRLAMQLAGQGFLPEAKEAVQEATQDTGMLQTLFDPLQVDQFAITGFVDEFIKTGDFGKAFEQAAVEIGNAAPGLELRRARRLGWADILKHTDFFGGETATDRYSRAVVGFLGDVFLSPLTYTGFGLGKVFNAARKAGGSAAAVDIFAKAGVPGAQLFGKSFIPHFDLKQFGLRGGEEAEKAVSTFLEHKAKYHAEINLGTQEMSEVVRGLRAGLTDDEAHLMTLFMDQGDETFQKIMKGYLGNRGELDRFTEVMEKATAFRNTWFAYGQAEKKMGILDENILRAWDDYVPGRLPIDKRSLRKYREFLERGKFNEFLTKEQIDAIDPTGGLAQVLSQPAAFEGSINKMIGTGTPTFAHSKIVDNILERTMMGLPTELDIGRVAMKRGIEHVRAMASKRLIKTFLDDQTLVKKFDKGDLSLFKDPAFLDEMQKRGYTIVDPVSLKEYTADALKEMDETALVSNLVAAKPGVLMMPKAIYTDLHKANKFFTDEGDSASQLFKSFQKMQGLWKGYALFSPGYLMRNQQGNFFQNWLAGVTHPKRYAQSMALQAGGTENLPVIVRQAVEGILGRPLRMDDTWMEAGGRLWTGNDLKAAIDENGIFSSGHFTKDLLLDTERIMMTSMDRQIRKANLAVLSKGGIALKDALVDGGVEETQAGATARIWDAAGKSWSVNSQRPIEDFWESHGPRISFMNENQFKPEKGIPHLFQKEGETWTAHLPGGPIGMPYGDVERSLHAVFQKTSNPTADQLRKAIGAPPQRKIVGELEEELASARDASMSKITELELGDDIINPLAWDFRDLQGTLDAARKFVGSEPNWYKTFGNNFSELVGDKNMAEFSSVFSILSPQNPVERNLSDALVVMRVVREIYEKSGGKMNWEMFDKRLRPVVGEGKDAPKNMARDKAEVLKLGDLLAPGKTTTSIKDLYFTRNQTNQLKTLYKDGIFKGDMKTSAFVMGLYQQSKGAGFFPFTVNDVHIARLFGIAKAPRKTEDGLKQGFGFDTTIEGRKTYRWVQYQMAELARRNDMSPDDVQATLWLYSKKFLSPKGKGESAFDTVGGSDWLKEVGEVGTWASASKYAEPEIAKLLAQMRKAGDGAGGFNKSFAGLEDMYIPYVGGAKEVAYPLQQDWVTKMGERIVNITPRRGAFAIKGVVPTRDVSEEGYASFWNEALESISTPDGRKIKALQRLEDEWEFTHHIKRDVKGSEDGLEPDLSIVIRANDDATADAVASLMADGLRKDNASWHRAQRLTHQEASDLVADNAFLHAGAAVRLRKRGSDGTLGTPFTQEELRGFTQKGLEFHNPVSSEVRILSTKGETDEAFVRKIRSAIKDKTIEVEAYTHVGRSVAREDFGTAMQGGRVGVVGGHAGSPGMARGIRNSLHAEFDGILGQHAARNKWRVAPREGDAVKEGIGQKVDAGYRILEQRHGTAAKGAIQLRDEGQDIINLFEGHDFSTIVHESAHAFRRRLLFGEDLDVVEKWAKVKAGQWTVDQEEQFARAFERYLRDGESPTLDLGDVFVKIKDWMTDIYETLKGSPISADLDPEIKGVFNRMLGSGEVGELGADVARAGGAVTGLTGAPRNVGEALQDVGAVLEKYLGQNAPHLRYMRTMGRAMENNARGAHFIDKLEKLGEVQDAKASVNKYLFDYEQGLTEFEGTYMRSFFPFYSWLRFNIPLQLTAMLEDPGRYAKIPKLIQAIEGVTPEWRDTPTPDYYEELHAVRLPIIMNGKPTFVNPNLPFQDLNKMNWKDILSAMTPFTRVLGEYMPEKGYSVFMERPIEKYPGEPSEVMPFFTKKQEHLAMTFLPTYGKIQRGVKAYQRDELPAQLLTELAGIKLMNADPGRVLRGNAHAQKQALRGIRDKLEDEGKIAKRTTRRGRKRRPYRPIRKGGEGVAAKRLLEE